jgi:hypothetical protein
MSNAVHPRKTETESSNSSYSYDDFENDFEDGVDSNDGDSPESHKKDAFQNRPSSRDKIHHLERKSRSSRANSEQDQEDADYLDQVLNSNDEVEGDPSSPTSNDNNSEDNNPSPTRVEKDGTQVYQRSGEEGDVTLNAIPKGGNFVVTTTGKVSIRPVDPKDAWNFAKKAAKR